MKILTWIEAVLTGIFVVGWFMVVPKLAWVREHPNPDAAEQLLKQHYESLGHIWEVAIYYPWALFTIFYLAVCVIFVAVQMFKRLLHRHDHVA